MDYNNDNSESWNWHREDYCLQKDPNSDISECLWNGVPQNEEDLSYMLDETTPIKACGDLAYHVSHSENMTKEPEECRETSSQVKRRRMLQFNSQAMDPSHEEKSSAFLKSIERGRIQLKRFSLKHHIGFLGLQEMHLLLLMRAWITHLKSGLQNALMILR